MGMVGTRSFSPSTSATERTGFVVVMIRTPWRLLPMTTMPVSSLMA